MSNPGKSLPNILGCFLNNFMNLCFDSSVNGLTTISGVARPIPNEMKLVTFIHILGIVNEYRISVESIRTAQSDVPIPYIAPCISAALYPFSSIILLMNGISGSYPRR